MTLGQRIAAIREDAGLTREDLARQADLTYTYIYKLETGRSTKPSEEVVNKIAVALGVTTDQLMGRLPLPAALAALQAEGVPDKRLQTVQEMWPDLSEAERELAVNMLRSVWRLRHPLREQGQQGAPGKA